MADILRGLDTLMTTLGITSNSRYDGYWNANMRPLENQNLNIAGFEWDIPQVSFDYSILEAKDKVSAMATYVSISSEPVAVGADATLRKLTGTVPRQKHLVRITEEDLRNKVNDLNDIVATADFMTTNRSVALRDYLEDFLFETQADIAERHKNSLNFAVGQVKSLASLEITTANNPRGIAGVKFSMHVPSANVKKTPYFTGSIAEGTLAEIEGKDPLADLANEVFKLRYNSYGSIVLEMDETFAHYFVRHSKVLPKLGYVINPALRVAYNDDKQAGAVAGQSSDEALYNALRQYLNVDAVLVSPTFVEVDKYNKVSGSMVNTRLRAFNPGTILLRPSGIIGKIKNVAPIRPDESNVVSTGIFDRHGIVEYRYDAKAKTQEWVSELTTLPVLTRPKDMRYFECIGE